MSWFNFYNEALRGMGTSYFDDAPQNVALHTDVGSPLATDPTWSKLPADISAALLDQGQLLWHDLVRYLRPHIVLWSTARRLLGLVDLPATSEWRDLVSFPRRKDGTLRRKPFVAQARSYLLPSGERPLFVFAPAQVKPLGDLSHPQKRELGAAILEAYRRER